MGIKIHHGPDGTYKTSGAIKDDIIPLIKTGRTLVTNVRGFSRDNAIKVLGKKHVHKDFKVIFVDTEIQQGRDKLARFFHWAPDGAFFVIDEVQRIFKPAWREKDLQELSNYSGSDKRQGEIPDDIHVAWDMQRHYSWDFVFTTTSITKVRSEMRDMAKVAIRHYNLNLWRFYKTVEHGADSRGTSQSSQGTVKYFNYVPKKVFDLYASTKTGTFQNTNPRTAFYKDPKVVGLLSLLVLIWSYVLSKPAPSAIGGSSSSSLKAMQKTDEKANQPSETINETSNTQVNNAVSNDVVNINAYQSSALDIPSFPKLQIVGSLWSQKEKTYIFDAGQFQIASYDLKDLGYSVKWITSCKALIQYKEYQQYAFCSFKREQYQNEYQDKST
jgi:zona occludens toxin